MRSIFKPRKAPEWGDGGVGWGVVGIQWKKEQREEASLPLARGSCLLNTNKRKTVALSFSDE